MIFLILSTVVSARSFVVTVRRTPDFAPSLMAVSKNRHPVLLLLNTIAPGCEGSLAQVHAWSFPHFRGECQASLLVFSPPLAPLLTLPMGFSHPLDCLTRMVCVPWQMATRPNPMLRVVTAWLSLAALGTVCCMLVLEWGTGGGLGKTGLLSTRQSLSYSDRGMTWREKDAVRRSKDLAVEASGKADSTPTLVDRFLGAWKKGLGQARSEWEYDVAPTLTNKVGSPPAGRLGSPLAHVGTLEVCMFRQAI